MRTIYLTLLFLGVFLSSNAQIVYIPDRDFKISLLASSVNSNYDDYIQVSEALATSTLTISNSNITDLTGLEDFTNLTRLTINGAQVTSLDLSPHLSLQNFYCYNLPNLNFLNITQNIDLKVLSVYNNSQLPNLDLTQNINIVDLRVHDNLLMSSIDITQNTKLKALRCYNSNLNNIDLSQNTNLETLYCYNNLLTDLDLTFNPNLTIIKTENNLLSSLDLSHNIKLTQLSCNDNQIEDLDLSQNTSLTHINCQNNQLTNIDITQVMPLIFIRCFNNQLFDIDISQNSNLGWIECNNNLLTEIDISQNPKLIVLFCHNNQITNLDISQNAVLRDLFCYNNQLTNLNLGLNTKLEKLYCQSNLLNSLYLNDNINLSELNCDNNELTELFLKNGQNESVSLSNNPNLSYICADESQISSIQSKVAANVVVGSYCNFTPGGNYNSVSGSLLFDTNNDGCDINDITSFPNTAYFKITNGGITSGTFSNASGDYLLYAATGNYTLSAVLENPGYYTISPSTANFSFPSLNNLSETQDFCIVADGIHPDLEVVIIPITQTRPGFDCKLKIVCKNKGNQVMNGNVEFNFDDSILDFVTSSIAPDLINTGSLTWNFSNLTPFESKFFEVSLNANTSLETPPLNGGDIVSYSAALNPIAGDETPDDNTFTLNQTVVNSYDPNDKTCLEGNTITPDLVGEYVHYLIRCENTGTAEAINIVIKDVIDTAKFDLSTLFITDSSHDMVTRINDNAVEFIFENINLPFDDANNDGYVAFKIKTLSTLQVGDTFENVAEIYFDYNFPIETNIAQTSIENPLSINDFGQSCISFKIYPNPTSDIMYLEAKETIKLVSVYGITGRMIQKISFVGNSNKVEISTKNLTKGTYFIEVSSTSGHGYKKLVKK